MIGSRAEVERKRFDAALLAEEPVLSVVEAKTVIPATTRLGVTEGRVVYTSARRSWTAGAS